MSKAELMARLSEIIYKKNTRIKEELLKLKINKSFIYQEKDLKWMLVECQGEKIIAIRGSSNTKNWIRNLNFLWAKTIKGLGKFHRGFINGSQYIEKHLKFSSNNVNEFSITGHSLGGALAFDLGLLLEESGVNIKDVYTFGEPMSCKRLDYEPKFNHYRYINNLDIVSTIPPSIMGYEHYGEELYVNDMGSIIKEPSEWEVNIDRLSTLYKNKRLSEFILDHPVRLYVDALSNDRVDLTKKYKEV